MSFVGNYSLTQSGTSTLNFTDTSTGSDPSITERRIYLYKYDGTVIVPSGNTTGYIVWAIGSTSKTVSNILDRDYALNVYVLWYTPTPDAQGTYYKNILTLFKAYTSVFLYGLTQEKNVANPRILSDTNFANNKFYLIELLDDAINAVDPYQDIDNAQLALNTAYEMIQNPTRYF